MGSALVKTFLKHGYPTNVWNRTRSRCEPLAAQGAQIVASVSDAIQTADIIIVNINGYATSMELLHGDAAAGRLTGKSVVQLTTGTPRQSREMAAWAETHNVRYLDGAIMVTPDLVGGPECTVLYSGPTPLFEKHKSVLESLGGSVVYVGTDYGHASTLDSAILCFFWAYNLGVHHAIALCQAEGFPLDVLTKSLSDMTPFLQRMGIDQGKRVETQTFGAELATLAICHHSVKLLIEQSNDAGIDHGMLDAFDRVFQQAVDAGHSKDDLAVLNKFMRVRGAVA